MSRGSDELLPTQVTPYRPEPAEFGGMAPDGGFAEEESSVSVGRYVDAVLRRKWMILGLGATGFAVAIGVSKMVVPVYEAQATIHIETTPRGQQPTASPIRTSQLFESRAWIDVLRSFRVLDQVARQRQLYLVPAIAGDSALLTGLRVADTYTPGRYVLERDASGVSILRNETGAELDRAAPGDSLGRPLGFRWVPDTLPLRGPVEFTVLNLREVANRLNADLNAALPPVDGAIMRLTYRGTDPDAISATLNAIADRFVETAAELKREKLTDFTEILQRQLSSAYAELRDAETSLEDFRVGAITLPSDRGGTPIAPGLAETRDPVFGAFFRLRMDREDLANQREAIARVLRTPGDTGVDVSVALGAIQAVRESSELSATLLDLGQRRAEARRLRIGFTSEHPPLRQLEREITELERVTVPAQAREVMDNLDLRIRDIDTRIASSSREMQQIPPRVAEEARRERRVSIAANLYTSLQNSFEQAKLAELSAAPDVRVLDRSVPPRTPVRDQMLMILAGGLLGGLGLGLALALLLDRMDTRIRYPEQITQGLRIGILGALPLVRLDKAGRQDAESASHLLEALRSIRMSMVYAHGTAGTFVTTITSPGSGEGKSFLAANLAKSFADAGNRTLLIDGDTRRGALHRALGGFRKPGLLDFLSGTASLDQVIQRIADRGIDFIGCGTRQSGGPELLASSQMAQLLMGLRSRYSVILIDCPPLGAGVDPLVLASLAGSMVLVLRNGVSDRELAESKLVDIQRLPIRILGAVLNDVEPTGAYRYYSYLPGYRAEDEVAEEEAAASTRRRSLLGRG